MIFENRTMYTRMDSARTTPTNEGREPGRINTWDDGRGLYFDDPAGHLLEIIIRPYGSGGTAADRPHPLVAPTLDPADHDGGCSDRKTEVGEGTLAQGGSPIDGGIRRKPVA